MFQVAIDPYVPAAVCEKLNLYKGKFTRFGLANSIAASLYDMELSRNTTPKMYND